MITLCGGPAAGSYAVRRAPLFLRAVVGRNGHRDVLDQLDDTPRPGEHVYVYRLATEPSMVMICIRGKGRAGSGLYASAAYLPYGSVDGEQLRDTAAWQSWATEERERLLATLPVD